jgi:hypothetical protein
MNTKPNPHFLNSNNNNNDSLTLTEIHNLLKALDRYSDHDVVQKVLQEAFEK